MRADLNERGGIDPSDAGRANGGFSRGSLQSGPSANGPKADISPSIGLLPLRVGALSLCTAGMSRRISNADHDVPDELTLLYCLVCYCLVCFCHPLQRETVRDRMSDLPSLKPLREIGNSSLARGRRPFLV